MPNPDDPSIPSNRKIIATPASPAERWQALYGTRPSAHSQALIAAALIYAEQVEEHGDVAPAIQHDLAILAHQLRVARLARRTNTDGASGATEIPKAESGSDEAGPGAVSAIPGAHSASDANLPNERSFVTRETPPKAPDLPPPASRRRAPSVP